MFRHASLKSRDTQAVLDFVAGLMEPCDIDLLARWVVERLPQLVRSIATVWNELDTQHGRVLVVMEPESDAVWVESTKALFIELSDEHPVIAHYRRTLDGRPYAISDFLTVEEFHATVLYERVYRPLGVEDQVLFVLPGPPSPAIAVAVNRTERDFTCRDRTVLNVVRPHLVQAYRNAEVFCRLRLAMSALEAAVDERGEGLAVVDQRGRVEFATPRAATLLQRWFGPRPEPDLARLLSVDRKVLTSTARGKGQLLSVPVVRGSVNGARWRLLLAEQSAGRDSPRLDSLALTRREGDVLALVASGYTNAEVADRLCVQPATVRKHLEHVYAKLGVQNRTAAARIALQTCAVVGSDGSARLSLGSGVATSPG